MSMHITQEVLDRAALVLVVGEDGLHEWSSTRPDRAVVDMLRSIADGIEAERL